VAVWVEGLPGIRLTQNGRHGYLAGSNAQFGEIEVTELLEGQQKNGFWDIC
jgi:hypothetical protein